MVIYNMLGRVRDEMQKVTDMTKEELMRVVEEMRRSSTRQSEVPKIPWQAVTGGQQ